MWLPAAVILCLVATAAAKPVAQTPPDSYGTPATPDEEFVIYRLKVKTDQIPELNDKYLSISDDAVGVFAHRQPLQVYNVTESDGSTSLHTWPIGIVDRALTLVNPLPGGGDGDVGEAGDLYDLKDTVPNQRANRGESPTTKPLTSWDEFDLNEQTREVEWLGSEGEDNEQKWVVFPAPAGEENFVVRWRGGVSFTTQNFFKISIIYEEVEK